MREPIYSSRPDLRKAAVVEQGLSLIGSHGRDVASTYMESARVPFSVIVRVLSEPAWRRRLVVPPS
ncbi:MAG: hypothetical protein ACEQSK_03140 [Sphingomonadaceae bacterium]